MDWDLAPYEHSPHDLSISALKEEMLDGFGLLQKEQVMSPFQFLFDKLLKNHMEIYVS